MAAKQKAAEVSVMADLGSATSKYPSAIRFSMPEIESGAEEHQSWSF